jgi:hypothetical protein
MQSHSASVSPGICLFGASPVTIVQQPFGAADAGIIDRVFFTAAFLVCGVFLAFAVAPRGVVLDVFFGVFFGGALAFDGFLTDRSLNYTRRTNTKQYNTGPGRQIDVFR